MATLVRPDLLIDFLNGPIFVVFFYQGFRRLLLLFRCTAGRNEVLEKIFKEL